jgi:hypothetical protein
MTGEIINQPCQKYTLSECVENYLADRQISKKKYFPAYLQMAKKEWQLIFRNTLWVVQSKWETLKELDGKLYIDSPTDASRVFGVSVEDHCHLLQPLFYNNQLNIVQKPKRKHCGCESCQCGGLCVDVNSFAMTTNLVFTINGIPFYEKIWMEYCKNGDILEYKEIPTKKYNSTTGDGGDFNSDFNDDYSIAAAPFSDYTVVTVKQQRKICKLEILSCGCPSEIPENVELLNNFCGCNLTIGCNARKRHCKQYFENVNNNHWGEIKFGDDNKIYYQPSKRWQHLTGKKLPDFLQVDYQPNGLKNDSEVLVPDYAIDAMEAGINYRAKRFNTKYSAIEREDAKVQAQMEKDKVMAFLHSIDLIFMDTIQDAPIRW